MYAAIYSYEYQNGRRKHLGNITNIEHETTERTFDLNSANVTGYYDFELIRPLIYVINDERGRQQFAGFVRNTKPLAMNHIEFIGDDFKKVLDTDVLLDFSNTSNLDFTIKGIFTLVSDKIRSTKDPFIAALDLDFIIPNDTTDTKIIADYTGQYIIVNAMQFLKVYLSFFGYYVHSSYDVIQDRVVFEFKKASSQIVDIKLKDFTHEKTSADIKVNKVIATITFVTTEEGASWIASDEAYYNSQSFSNRGSLVGTELPGTAGYAPGFALKLVTSLAWATATAAEYEAATPTNRGEVFIRAAFPDPEGNIACPPFGPTFNQATNAAGNANDHTEGKVIGAIFRTTEGEICATHITYIKTVAASRTFHKLSDVTYKPRPNLPEKVYTLGNDNEIYEGYAPAEKRIYPIVTKVFESGYLSEAQLNAVYELVNNRFVENIIVTQTELAAPINLEFIGLFTPIRVWDDQGGSKVIPISEKTFVHRKNDKRCDIKLGFKKTLLTEVIKNDIGVPEVVKSAGGSGGSSTVIEKFEVWTGELEPDPNLYNTWFRPLGVDLVEPTGEMSGGSMLSELSNEAEGDPAQTTELEVEGASPYEST